MFCHADLLALTRLCGFAPPADRSRGVMNATSSRSSWVGLKAAPSARLSRPCMQAVLCRDVDIGHSGACWGAYGYHAVLPELVADFRQRMPAVLAPAEVARPCGGVALPAAVTRGPAAWLARVSSSIVGDRRTTDAKDAKHGVVYMRCGDYLGPRRGHLLLKYSWLDGVAPLAFARVSHVVIVTNRKTHVGGRLGKGKSSRSEGATRISAACVALADALRTRLTRLLGPSGPPVSLAPEVGIYEDLHCATSARVLVVASWGTSFGHWAALLSQACTVVLPQLQGLVASLSDGGGRPVVGGKHQEPIAWHGRLRYVAATRAQWVHVPDLKNASVLGAKDALAILND